MGDYDSICVIVDRLTIDSHIIFVQMKYRVDELAQVYLNHIVYLHGVPISTIFD